MRAPSSTACRGVAVVSHAAHHTGAPYIALNIARELKLRRGIAVTTILLRAGPLRKEFAELGPVFIAPGRPRSFRNDPRIWAKVIKSGIWCLQHLITKCFWARVRTHLRRRNFLGAVCNTILSGEAAVQLSRGQISSIGLIHEMPHTIRAYHWENEVNALLQGATALVFPSPRVQQAFTKAFPIPKPQFIAPQSFNIDLDQLSTPKYLANRAITRKRLHLSDTDILILGCGQGGFRKGIDLFFQAARDLCLESGAANPRTVFVWVGALVGDLEFWLERDITELRLSERVIFVEQQIDVAPYFAAADIFFLSSREDPFPTVVLEAMAHGVPVVGFANSGGLEDQIAGGAGIAVPFGDVTAAVRALRSLADQPNERAAMGNQGREKIAHLGGFDAYVDSLIKVLHGV
jgi:O-antigen biosynthesis protein